MSSIDAATCGVNGEPSRRQGAPSDARSHARTVDGVADLSAQALKFKIANTGSPEVRGLVSFTPTGLSLGALAGLDVGLATRTTHYNGGAHAGCDGSQS